MRRNCWMSHSCARLYSLVLVGVILGIVPAAKGWHGPGHMLVAGIAWEQLKGSPDPVDNQTCAKIAAILEPLRKPGTNFPSPLPVLNGVDQPDERDLWLVSFAATWPDEVRKTPWTAHHRRTWHYFDRPIPINFKWTGSAIDDAIAQTGLNLDMSLPAGTTLGSQNLNAVQAIALARSVLRDDHRSADDRATAMCWLLHLVGDIHQPLHTATLVRRNPDGKYSIDGGGNGVWLAPGKSPGKNLHAFWDGQFDDIETTRDHHQEIDFEELSDRIADLLGNQQLRTKVGSAANDLDISVWLDEGYKLAKEDVYTRSMIRRAKNPANGQTTGRAPHQKTAFTSLSRSLGSRYENRAQNDAEKRVLLGGLRLAAILRSDLNGH